MEKQLRKRVTFESFLLKQVSRLRIVYLACSIVYFLLGIATVVMTVMILIMRLPISKGIFLLLMGAGFFFAGNIYKGIAASYKAAADEIRYGPARPGSRFPDDYGDSTKQICTDTCYKLKSIGSLIFAYGFIALILWGFTPLMFWASGIFGDSFQFEPVLLAAAFIMPAMALPLTLLAIAYALDHSETKRFMPQILEVLEK